MRLEEDDCGCFEPQSCGAHLSSACLVVLVPLLMLNDVSLTEKLCGADTSSLAPAPVAAAAQKDMPVPSVLILLLLPPPAIDLVIAGGARGGGGVTLELDCTAGEAEDESIFLINSLRFLASSSDRGGRREARRVRRSACFCAFMASTVCFTTSASSAHRTTVAEFPAFLKAVCQLRSSFCSY